MKYEKVNDPAIFNRLYRHTRLQSAITEFWKSPDRAVKCVFNPGEYVNAKSAQASFCHCIKRLGYRMKARILNGELYLIKL